MSVEIRSSGRGILHLHLADAESGNVLTPTMERSMLDAVAGLTDDARALILSADGPDFCLGRLSPMPARDSQATAADLRRLVAEPVLRLYSDLRTAPVPVIALVQGRAVGAGCALTACADLVIAADDASFSVPELDRDIPPLLVMTALFRRVHPQSAARLVLTSASLDAQAACAHGLAGMVVPRSELAATGEALADRLSRNTPLVLRTIKAFMLESADAGSYGTARGTASGLISLALGDRYRAAAPAAAAAPN